MKLYIIVAVLLFALAGAISYFYDHLTARRAARRERKKLLAHLVSMPPFKADVSTPEGVVLCFENCIRQRDIEAAAACRDFAAEARLWLQERGHLSTQTRDEILPETIKAMEKSFRDGMAKGMPADWILGKSYFLKHEPFAENIVKVNKYTQVQEGDLYSQQILVAKTAGGWRVVKTLPPPLDN